MLLAFRSRREERRESGAGVAWEHLNSSSQLGMGRTFVPLIVLEGGTLRTGHFGPFSFLELLIWPPSP